MSQEPKPQGDPLASALQLYEAMLKSWSDAMGEVVASPAFADSMAQHLQANLDALALARRQVSELTEQYLQHASLPTQGQVLGLAERLTNIEMRLDDLDAKLDQVLDLLKARPDSRPGV